MATNVPRDVLKWLMGLNLPQPIKNVRRDFSNGYLVAEVCARYYPSDFSLHSYDPAAASASKKQINWGLIEKGLKRRNFAVSKPEVEAIVSAESDAVIAFLQRLHAFLVPRTPSGAGAGGGAEERDAVAPLPLPRSSGGEYGAAGPAAARAGGYAGGPGPDGHGGYGPPQQAAYSPYGAPPQQPPPQAMIALGYGGNGWGGMQGGPYGAPPQQQQQQPQQITMRNGGAPPPAFVMGGAPNGGRPGPGPGPDVRRSPAPLLSWNLPGDVAAGAGSASGVSSGQYDGVSVGPSSSRGGHEEGYPMRRSAASSVASEPQGYLQAGPAQVLTRDMWEPQRQGPAHPHANPGQMQHAQQMYGGPPRGGPAGGHPGAAAEPYGGYGAGGHHGPYGGPAPPQHALPYPGGGGPHYAQPHGGPGGYGPPGGGGPYGGQHPHHPPPPQHNNPPYGHAGGGYGGHPHVPSPPPHPAHGYEPHGPGAHHPPQHHPYGPLPPHSEGSMPYDAGAAGGGAGTGGLVHYTPYTLADYKQIKKEGKYWELGSLGPDLESARVLAERERLRRIQDFGRQVYRNNLEKLKAKGGDAEAVSVAGSAGGGVGGTRGRGARPPPSARQKALDFASKIPKPPPAKPRHEGDENDAPGGAGEGPGGAPGGGLNELEALELQHKLDQERVRRLLGAAILSA